MLSSLLNLFWTKYADYRPWSPKVGHKTFEQRILCTVSWSFPTKINYFFIFLSNIKLIDRAIFCEHQSWLVEIGWVLTQVLTWKIAVCQFFDVSIKSVIEIYDHYSQGHIGNTDWLLLAPIFFVSLGALVVKQIGCNYEWFPWLPMCSFHDYRFVTLVQINHWLAFIKTVWHSAPFPPSLPSCGPVAANGIYVRSKVVVGQPWRLLLPWW